MLCPSCSCEIPDEAGFCAFCGERIRRCRACTESYPADVRYCGHCGADILQHGVGPDSSAPSVRGTSSGHPGHGGGRRPTFTLPHQNDQPDANVYGYLYDPNDPSRRHEIRRGDNTLGAGHNNDIVVDRPAVSWNHALLICRNNKVFLQDSASTNGTFLAGAKLDRPRRLVHGDAVRFGDVTYGIWLLEPYR